jgi:hypothetical protein
LAHGFFRSAGGVFSTFDAPGRSGVQIFPMSIGPDGTVTGNYLNTDGHYAGFIRNHDGVVRAFNLQTARKSVGLFPYSINSSDAITGVYEDLSFAIQGFLRTSDGTFTAFMVPGAGATFALGINSSSVITGYFSAGVPSRGFLRMP